MKKLLAMILSVLMVLTLMPVQARETAKEVIAEGDYPDVPNIQIDADGMMTWDAVPDATYYHIYYKDEIHSVGSGTSETSFNVKKAFRESGFKTGDYQIRIQAVDRDRLGNTVAESHSPVYHYVNDNQCTDPTGLYWDGYVVRWDDLGEGYSYSIWLYEEKDGTDRFVRWYTISDNYYDMSTKAYEKTINYYIGVVAQHRNGSSWEDNWADSNMVISEKKPGRFTQQDISLSISGDYLTFSDIVDDEGNEPGSYYVIFGNKELSSSKTVDSKTFNIKEILDERGYDEGYWKVYGYAYSQDGVKISNYSNEVIYKYGDAEKTKITLTYYDDKNEVEMYQEVLEAEPGEVLPIEAPNFYNDRFFYYWSTYDVSVSDYYKPTTSVTATLYDGTLTAHYHEMYEISVKVSPEEAGTFSGGGIFYPGETRYIWAGPNEGYHFLYWVYDNTGEIVDTDQYHYITMDNGVYQQSYTAVFEKNIYSAEIEPIDFGAAQEGYSTIPSKTIKITNTGNTDIVMGDLTMTGDKDAFTLDWSYIPSYIYTDHPNDSYWIYPKTGLTSGSGHSKTYTVTLTLRDYYGYVEESIDVSFTVTDNTLATLTFDNNGVEATQLKPLTVPVDEMFKDIAKDREHVYPEAEGYVFEGWYYDKECEDFVFPDETFSHDTTLYANWYHAVDTVKFTAPLPEAGMKESDYPYDSIIPLENSGIWELDDYAWSLANADTFEETFEAGETYYLTLSMYIDTTGYGFQYDYYNNSPNVKCIINGEDKAIYRAEGGLEGLTLWIPYTIPVPVTSVSLNKSSLTLDVGKSETLTATVLPENATNKNVTWKSSDPSVASVDSNGKVTALKKGTTTITVTTEDGGKTATCSVTVNEPVVHVTSVSLNKTSLTLNEGDTETLTATISPSNATDKRVAWTSSDNSVATVDDSGKVTAKKEGTAIISVTTKDGDKTASCTVTVKKEDTPTPPDPVTSDVTRLSGKDRYLTSLKVADELKKVLGVDKFDNIVLATGENFADALGGGYLAAKKNAPIILTKAKKAGDINEYIRNNLKEGGTVYILGGEGALGADCLTGLEGINQKRLSGKTRYDTSLAILEEAGVSDEPILIATGKSSADSLSASALGLPMLLIDGKKDSLNEKQKAFLTSHSSNTFYILGGEGAVSSSIEAEISSIHSVTRIKGSTRYDTTLEIADTFYPSSSSAVLAAAKDKEFPDGLCAGPLAYALKAPIILTNDGKEDKAVAYTTSKGIHSGYITGGAARISDDTAKAIFGVEEIK